MRRSSGSAAIVVALLLLLVLAPALYVASVGPVVWFVERGLIPAGRDSAASVFYSPLEWAAQNCGPVQVVMDWYLSFFRTPRPDPIVY
jgi:hypothetical protein